ncbi:MAG: hypothetical protein IJ164_09230 [Duodenibacillus sp.]|nr:hypothetical protein [Duodenibacillus sp.]
MPNVCGIFCLSVDKQPAGKQNGGWRQTPGSMKNGLSKERASHFESIFCWCRQKLAEEGLFAPKNLTRVPEKLVY